jgi:hypothetical protein
VERGIRLDAVRRATHIRRPRHAAAPRGVGDGPPPPAVGARPEVLLAWALDRERRRVHVSALDPRRRGDRAPFACPGCGEPVVPRLGAVRARHFAHRPGSTCPLTRPETALHLNAKERLLFLCAEAFAGRLRVRLGARCPGCRREAPLDLAAVGDAASAEGSVGALRADVLVTRGGAPALALEVRVTHALDPAKEEALAALSVPALEIDAREPWEEEPPGEPSGAARPGGPPPLVGVRVARTVAGRAAGRARWPPRPTRVAPRAATRRRWPSSRPTAPAGSSGHAPVRCARAGRRWARTSGAGSSRPSRARSAAAAP